MAAEALLPRADYGTRRRMLVQHSKSLGFLSRAKVPAIRAALTGRIINGLVTDENTAAALLQAG